MRGKRHDLVTPLTEFIEEYLTWREVGKAPRTIETDRSILYRLAEFAPTAEVFDLNGPDGAKLITRFFKAELHGKADATKRQARSLIANFTDYLVKYGYIVADPEPLLPKIKATPPRPDPLPWRTAEQIVVAQPRTRWRLALLLAFSGALRRGELQRVQFKHYDGGTLLVLSSKTKDRRRLPLTEDLRLLFERCLLEEPDTTKPDHYLLYPEKPINLGPLKGEMIHQPHKPMADGTVWRWWRDCLLRADVPHTRFHRTRHTAATEFNRVVKNVAQLQAFGGWKSPSTPLAYYAQVSDAEVVAGMEAVRQSRKTSSEQEGLEQ